MIHCVWCIRRSREMRAIRWIITQRSRVCALHWCTSTWRSGRKKPKEPLLFTACLRIVFGRIKYWISTQKDSLCELKTCWSKKSVWSEWSRQWAVKVLLHCISVVLFTHLKAKLRSTRLWSHPQGRKTHWHVQRHSHSHPFRAVQYKVLSISCCYSAVSCSCKKKKWLKPNNEGLGEPP